MNYPDYPFESHFADILGLQLHYLDEGSPAADPVVMLHGNPSWSFYYRHLTQALRETKRCIVPDHIGMGLSAKPEQDDYNFSLDSRVDDLERLLEHLQVKENITFIVHDWGGMIGMAYATRYPERIKKLVILNTAAFHLAKNRSISWQLKLSRIPLLNAVLNQGLNAFCRGAVRYCVTRKPMSPEVASAYLAPYDSWHNRLAVRKFVEVIPLQSGDKGYDTVTRVEDGLQQFREIPILICWGMKDFVFDSYFLEEWEKHFPKASVHRFNDAGHYVLEDAGEELIPLISKFINQQ
jgi:pimeloyl-ACP methyl ester carboxylesterase